MQNNARMRVCETNACGLLLTSRFSGSRLSDQSGAEKLSSIKRSVFPGKRRQATANVDEVTEGALQGESFDGEGAGGFTGAGVLAPQRLTTGGGLVSVVLG